MSAMGKERESASEVVSPPAFPTIRSAAAMYLSISVDGFLDGKVAHTNIEFRDGGETQLWKITVGEVDWIEPTDRVHCAVNVGKEILAICAPGPRAALDANDPRICHMCAWHPIES